ncbi:MAG: hypothetical protein LH603_07785 [Pseudonocardia sp.]|nr:hypothetical protein [Pseudonocardia sp.]
MVAVPEIHISALVGAAAAVPLTLPSHGRRVVAVAAGPMELLRPESDLARLIRGASRVDLLLAADDPPDGAPCALALLGSAEGLDPTRGPHDGAGDPREPGTFDALDDGLCDDLDDLDEDDPDADPAEVDDLRERVDELGLSGLAVHRLGLREPLGSPAENDLVAALSELVGFDPEPGVYCLAPAPAPADPARTVIDRAVQRIAQVYGIPLLRYRCMELTVVGDDPS